DPLVLDMQGLRARWSGGSVHLANPDSVDADVLHDMRYLEHPENVAVTLEAARLLGIPRGVALAGIGQSEPDPGMAAVIDVPAASGSWTLVNLFAANDPESTFRALATVESLFGKLESPLLLFASRPDRTSRSVEFARALAEHQDRFPQIVVWGERTGVLVRLARRHGVAADAILDAGNRAPEELTDLVLDNLGSTRVVVGVGNIVGPAHRWLETLADAIEKAQPERADA